VLRRGRGNEFFSVQEGLFSLDAPAISGQGTVGADDAVAGDDDGDGVGGAGGGNGASGGWSTDLGGEAAVGGGCAEGKGLQGGPDALLKAGAVNVQRERAGVGTGGVDESNDLGEAVGIGGSGGDVGGSREAVVKVGQEGVWGIAKKEGAETVFGEGREDMAKAADAVGMAKGQERGHGEESDRMPLGLWDME